MNSRHAAALVLAVWYLMRPPLPHLKASVVHTDTAPPLSRWTIVRIFPTEKECEAHGQTKQWERCIASDDPDLKENTHAVPF
jgi:hypothetical protein